MRVPTIRALAARLGNAARPFAREVPLLRVAYFALAPTARRNARDDEQLRLLLALALKEDSCCIDVGAHRGSFLEHALRYSPRGQHIAFEPLPDLADQLRHRYPKIDVRTTALSDVAGRAEFIRYPGRPALSGLRARQHVHARAETLEVPLARLDDVLPEDCTPRVIKIDVEGAERQVLQGAMATILRCRPLVVFEHGKTGAPHYGTAPHHIYELLVKQAKFQLFDMDGDGPIDLVSFNELFESGARWNFVAVP
jgi:FkbM family methyltransferase